MRVDEWAEMLQDAAGARAVLMFVKPMCIVHTVYGYLPPKNHIESN
jgi:hypothetical protein